MTDDLSVAIKRLRTSSQRLNQISDEAAQLIQDIEQFLEETRVGVSATVQIGYGASSPNADSPDWADLLSYRRLNSGKFRVAFVRQDVESSHEGTVRPWSECTRDEKLQSLEKLPELLVELANQIEERTIRAEQVLSIVNASLQLPKKKKGG
jgi:hypothetical protein